MEECKPSGPIRNEEITQEPPSDQQEEEIIPVRDWFAGMALVGMGNWWPNVVGDYKAKAVWAYSMADAMLEARK